MTHKELVTRLLSTEFMDGRAGHIDRMTQAMDGTFYGTVKQVISILDQYPECAEANKVIQDKFLNDAKYEIVAAAAAVDLLPEDQKPPKDPPPKEDPPKDPGTDVTPAAVADSGEIT